MAPPPTLEDYLSAVSADLRQEILFTLNEQNRAVPFGELRLLLGMEQSQSPNLSHHLKPLVAKNLVDSTNGYRLTPLGEAMTAQLLAIKQLVDENLMPIFVRTSEFALEVFDATKISAMLVREAKMEPEQAEVLAEQIRLRLERANVNYLTGPLIREFLNGILLEQRLETFRHALTRLGLPPYDVDQRYEQGLDQHPRNHLEELGKAIAEQHLLLNQLPLPFADQIIRGEILIQALPAWALSPSCLLLSGEQAWHLIISPGGLGSSTIASRLGAASPGKRGSPAHALSLIEFLGSLRRAVATLAPFFPEGLCIYSFEEFLVEFTNQFGWEALGDLLGELAELNLRVTPVWLTLAVDGGLRGSAGATAVARMISFYVEAALSSPVQFNWVQLPLLQVRLDKKTAKEIVSTPDLAALRPETRNILTLCTNHNAFLTNFYLRGRPLAHMALAPNLSPLVIDDHRCPTPVVSLGSLGINLPAVAYKAGHDDDAFTQHLDRVMHKCFDAFEAKYKFLRTCCNQFHQWPAVATHLFGYNPFASDIPDLLDYRGPVRLVCSLRYFGLEQAMKYHTGTGVVQSPKTLEFAATILKKMGKVCADQSGGMHNVEYSLAESRITRKIFTRPRIDYGQFRHEGKPLEGSEFPFYTTSLTHHAQGIKQRHLCGVIARLAEAGSPHLIADIALPEVQPGVVTDAHLKLVAAVIGTKCPTMCFTRMYQSKAGGTTLAYVRNLGPYFPVALGPPGTHSPWFCSPSTNAAEQDLLPETPGNPYVFLANRGDLLDLSEN